MSRLPRETPDHVHQLEADARDLGDALARSEEALDRRHDEYGNPVGPEATEAAYHEWLDANRRFATYHSIPPEDRCPHCFGRGDEPRDARAAALPCTMCGGSGDRGTMADAPDACPSPDEPSECRLCASGVTRIHSHCA